MTLTKQEWRRIADVAMALIRKGQFIESIKYLREQTGCGLKEAWTAANALRDLVR